MSSGARPSTRETYLLAAASRYQLTTEYAEPGLAIEWSEVFAKPA